MSRMKVTERTLALGAALAIMAATPFVARTGRAAEARAASLGPQKGICVVLGLPEADRPQSVVELARGSELLIYFQSPDANEVAAVRGAAERAELLGKRVFAARGDWRSIHLADNLAGQVRVSRAASGDSGVPNREILRVLHPMGKAVADGDAEFQTLEKPFPEGLDPWSHPYHRADNNPQSTDRVIRHPYLTQYLGYPLFGCISEVTVGCRGKLYQAFGHIAFKTAQNEVLNKLYCLNSHNGTILWSRPLREGFMVHRNTMIATPKALLLADDVSCKRIDSDTGEVVDQIVPPAGLTEGRVWKWMALEDGVLYALLGGEEIRAQLQRATTPGFGHWPWGMWKGYDYAAGEKAYGFGRDLLAIDPKTKKVLWHRRQEELIDSRGLCMKDGRIYLYCPGTRLACVDAADGKTVWDSSDAKLLAAIGPHGRAQHYEQGFSTSTYVKCNGKYLVFAGPQRPNLAAVACADGRLAWSTEGGNFQVVLRDDALYAIGSQKGISYVRDYDTGDVLRQFSGRRACTRATGTVDSIFFRAHGGTIRYAPESNALQHIAPMRPACHDGVIVSEGMLHWSPWVCGCHLSLYGNIGLAPAGGFDFEQPARDEDRLERGAGDLTQVAELAGTPRRDGRATVFGKLRFTAGADGVVKATGADDGRTVWKAYTAGGVNVPPAVWQGRAYVGSNDGCVHAFEAATGRLLWRFRAAPLRRVIPVYGRLMSTWPVGGGVVVADGTLYAAAGIAHYDGTHVFALDAVTGKIKWQNNNSGALAECANGISVQGELRIENGRLAFHGGNAYPRAEFDLATGKCLTEPHGPQGMAPSTFYEVDSYLKQVGDRESRRSGR